MSARFPSSSSLRRFAEDIVRKIVDQHHIAYFAGGCVRDDLLGIPPEDFDVATSAVPEQIRSWFGASQTQLVGAAFGVVRVHQRIEGLLHVVEVATFRTDGSYSDGRRPDRVEFSSPSEDAQRRDFTINGLFYDPIGHRVIDFVGGQEDLANRTLRAIGDPAARFAEDKLRLLRAIRFAARFDYAIEPTTWAAIQRMASEIRIVSPERIEIEMRKMLAHSRRSQALQLLVQSTLFEPVFGPFALPLVKPARLAICLARLDRLEAEDPLAALALILYSVDDGQSARQAIRVLREHWRISNHDAAALEFVLIHAATFFTAHHQPWSVLQPLLVSPSAVHALRFLQAMAVEEESYGRSLARCNECMAWPNDRLNPVPLVDGRMLMELGIPTGPDYARLIKSARAAQLDLQIHSREEAVAWVRQNAQFPDDE